MSRCFGMGGGGEGEVEIERKDEKGGYLAGVDFRCSCCRIWPSSGRSGLAVEAYARGAKWDKEVEFEGTCGRSIVRVWLT